MRKSGGANHLTSYIQQLQESRVTPACCLLPIVLPPPCSWGVFRREEETTTVGKRRHRTIFTEEQLEQLGCLREDPLPRHALQGGSWP
ncbi:hypothetical protein CEXT_770101 [Caerostris extrusa]|uniref:Homeobox domain-containing protein n=1 Tax=Caerostris extrusa TaxID=172846 RepID=A0AAV4Y475_CAEEX|nr:hypothetical protein CEXT_770101 [Caerostris extrusa]